MKHFIDLSEVSGRELERLIGLAIKMKAARKAGTERPLLAGKTLGMIFTKSSTRTRVSFEAGMYQLGGCPLVLNGSDLQIGRGEPISDTARVLSRYIDAIMIRTFLQSDIEALARYGSVPVINGLSDDTHPCQILADLMTVKECFGTLRGIRLAYVGDGNNVANTLLQGCPKVGMDVAIASPPEFTCPNKYIDQAKAAAIDYGAKVLTTADPAEAVRGADVVYSDTWVSMGMEAGKEERVKKFRGFTVDAELMSMAKPGAIYLHCLPAYRGLEVTDEVIEGPASRVFDEAENRLHAQKAVLVSLLLDGGIDAAEAAVGG